MTFPELEYDPQSLPRELKRHYISASENDIEAMLQTLGLQRLDDLFEHIPEGVRFKSAPEIDKELEYRELIDHVKQLAEKNKLPKASFIGDGLQNYQTTALAKEVLDHRTLTTAYTPYQPERSQGTLMTHWVYQCAMAKLTGFEAINVSMYDRSTTLYETILTALRLKKGKKGALLCGALYPGDIEVLHTHSQGTQVRIESCPCSEKTGQIDLKTVEEAIANNPDIGVLVFPQVNRFGCIEDVDAITDLAHERGLKTIAIVDPMQLSSGGLKPPSDFGQRGSDLFVAEGQHLAIGANGGGPGLGVFGIRFNKDHKTDIRSTPGRFIGKAVDVEGRSCLAQVISTREQHIRREKANSNICSNQAYIATVAGASILARGEDGMAKSITSAMANAKRAAQEITSNSSANLAFSAAFCNEFTLEVERPASELIEIARAQGLHLGVKIERADHQLPEQAKELIKLSFNDHHSEAEVSMCIAFFSSELPKKGQEQQGLPTVPQASLREGSTGLPNFSEKELSDFYRKLAEQNISPDNTIYPLGSCTMKYNPYVNDYAAGLAGFADTHPQAPIEDLQGNLEVLYATQKTFSKLLGLAGLTTQPVAGAQGELVGLKMIQAYHRDRNEERDIVLIPRSAHGTNPATATFAGYETNGRNQKVSGVVLVEADDRGLVDLKHLEHLLEQYGKRVAAIMVTNPNTSGLFEADFALVAQKVHDAGGLVYMDGANLNAIAGWINLGELGVDAVHSNTHKTWSIPHGGGGPGDAFVAVSDKLLDFLPGVQVVKKEGQFSLQKAPKSIGSVHRHFGNFAHKVRCYTYIRRLGREGVRRMSAVAVLSARYLQQRLAPHFNILPQRKEDQPCMHEFILGLPDDLFNSIVAVGVPKSAVISRLGKLFLDYGFHAPTVAWPEVYGIMIEPTETYSKAELDRFCDAILEIRRTVETHPEVLLTVPHFTPVDRVDDVSANRNLLFSEDLDKLPEILSNRVCPHDLADMPLGDITTRILEAHRKASPTT
jgi:glycine dehydrogenase